MRPKTAIILSAALAVCLGLMLLWRTGLFEATPSEASRAVFHPAPSKPTELTITDSKGNVLRFGRTKDDWRIVHPIEAKAENRRVNQVADAVRNLAGDKVEDLGNDITGLDSPLYVVKIVDDKGASYTLHVGKEAPKIGSTATRTYVRVPEAQDYVVAEEFTEKLSRPVREFRDKTIMDVRSDQVVRVMVSGKENYELLKRGGQWRFVSPFNAKAIDDKVSSLVRKAASLTANEIVSVPAGTDLGMFGLEDGKEIAVVRLTLRPEEPATTPATTKAARRRGKSYAIAFGRETEDLIYARRLDKDDVFLISTSTLKDLQPKMMDLRVKQTIDVEKSEVTKIDLELPGGPVALAKEDGTWQMVKPFAGRANASAINNMIDKINSLKAESFRDDVTTLAAYGLDPPKSRIAMTLVGQTQRPTLLIGNTSPSGDKTFVKSASAPAVAVLPSKDLKDLPSKAADLWDTTLLKLPQGANVTRLVMKRPDDTFTVVRDQKDPGKWSMLSPIEADADAENITSIIDLLKDLSATKIVFLGEKTQTPREYTRAKGIIVTAVTAASPATTAPAEKQVTKTHVLNVFKIKNDVFAMQPGKKVAVVGKCSSALYDDMLAELRGRNVWQIDPEKITGVKVLVEKKVTLEIVRKGTVWTYPKDPYVKIDAAKVKSFLDDIKKGKAEKFANYETKNLGKYRLDKPWFGIELTDQAGKMLGIEVSHVGAHDTDNRYAITSSTEGVFVISADLAGKMTKKLKDFKKE
ncbi:MAG: DUF4340 domain-containing protein [Phycisphaerae bacterium]|nr:DUF4340 domain-containing protein [Phycisphaerae bacterium]